MNRKAIRYLAIIAVTAMLFSAFIIPSDHKHSCACNEILCNHCEICRLMIKNPIICFDILGAVMAIFIYILYRHKIQPPNNVVQTTLFDLKVKLSD